MSVPEIKLLLLVDGQDETPDVGIIGKRSRLVDESFNLPIDRLVPSA